MPLNWTKKLLYLLPLVWVNLAISQSTTLQQTKVAQPIPVSFPTDATGEPNTEVTIPLTVGDLTDRNVDTYSMVFVFNPRVLRYKTFSIAGTVSEPAGVPNQNILNDSTVSIGKSGTQILSGAGTFINLIFDVIGQPGDTSPLVLNSFIFNSGSPTPTLIDGLFTVVAAPAPVISVQPDSFDFGDIFVDSSATASFTITNSGNADLEVSAVTPGGPDAGEFLVSGITFPLSIPPNGTSGFDVTFDPTAVGEKNATITVTSNDPANNALEISLRARAVPRPAPVISVSPDSFDFSSITIGTRKTQEFTIFNTGDAVLTVQALTILGNNADEFSLRAPEPPLAIQPGDSQAVSVIFAPMITGDKQAALAITSDDPATPEITVNLTGKGVSGKPVFFSIGDSADFNDIKVDSSATITFFLFNKTPQPVAVTSTRLSGPDADQFELVAGMAPFTVLSGDSALFAIKFAPTSANAKTATFELAYEGAQADTLSLFLMGTGLAPELTTFTDALDFGFVFLDSTESLQVKLQNSGNSDLILQQAFITGANAGQFNLADPPPGTRVQPQEDLQLIVTFNPTSEGPQTAQLIILSNDPARDTVRVTLHGTGVRRFQFSASIITPLDRDKICAEDVAVIIQVNTEGGLPPFKTICKVNGYVAIPNGGHLKAIVPLQAGENKLVATCTLVDGMGTEFFDSDSITVFRAQKPESNIQIVSPEDSSTVMADSVLVKALTSIQGGTPPFDVQAEINGIPATITGPFAEARIPITGQETLVVASITVTDSCGFTTTHSDSIRIFQPTTPMCQVSIISPKNGSFVCEDSVEVVAAFTLRNVESGQNIQCSINGEGAQMAADSTFVRRVSLVSGENKLVAHCQIFENSTVLFSCNDTVSVFLDDIAPECTFDVTDSLIVGTFFDKGSGIAGIAPVEIRNGILELEPFEPGDKSVGFKIRFIDPDRGLFFSIDVTDLCGNTTNCDPVIFTITAGSGTPAQHVSFPQADRYLKVRNNGLQAMSFTLNGRAFHLYADPARVETEPNAYFVAHSGEVILDLLPYLQASENQLQVAFTGASGAFADIFLTNEVERVDFVLDLQDVPSEFQLAQNYPNPFNPETRITFDIPADAAGNVKVQLRVFNLLGELVRTLVDDDKAPGRYTVTWDGKGGRGQRVASGVYIYQITAGSFSQTKRMLLLK